MRFLAEYYEPDRHPSAAAHIAERARAAVGELVYEGVDVQFLRATLLQADETCFLLYDAPSAEVVAEATQRAAIQGARITEAREDS